MPEHNMKTVSGSPPATRSPSNETELSQPPFNTKLRLFWYRVQSYAVIVVSLDPRFVLIGVKFEFAVPLLFWRTHSIDYSHSRISTSTPTPTAYSLQFFILSL